MYIVTTFRGGGAIIDDLKLTKHTNLVFSDPRYLLISFYSLGNSFSDEMNTKCINTHSK